MFDPDEDLFHQADQDDDPCMSWESPEGKAEMAEGLRRVDEQLRVIEERMEKDARWCAWCGESIRPDVRPDRPAIALVAEDEDGSREVVVCSRACRAQLGAENRAVRRKKQLRGA